MTVIEMQDNIIRRFGFENNNTIEFFYLCELYTKPKDTPTLNKIYKAIISRVQKQESEE